MMQMQGMVSVGVSEPIEQKIKVFHRNNNKTATSEMMRL